jgi:uncharacterized protein DUF3616
MAVEHQVELQFGEAGGGQAALEALSAVCGDRSWLWVAGDESPGLERLRADAGGAPRYDAHRSFRLGDLVDLPDGPAEEVDVEGLDLAGDHLWVVGSHSRTRKRVKPGDDDSEALDDLATVRSHPNRHVLIRLPVVDEEDGPVPVRSATIDGTTSTAALLDGSVGGLVDVLSADRHLAPFLAIPGKDNGLDVEGIVALEDSVLLGLRGPVLRGWAVVLELRLRDVPGRPARLALRSDGWSYRTFFLDLDGLGVRDLCRLGDDVLVLAGPTMDLDGPVELYRWDDAVRERKRLVRGQQLSHLGDLPYGTREDRGFDHPEGITLLPGAEQRSLLVVHDSPAPARTAGGVVRADVVPLPS